MHSSRMRTSRSLTVCWSLVPGGGVWPGGSGLGRGLVQGGLVVGGVWSRGGSRGVWSRGCLVQGVSGPGGLVQGGVCSQGGLVVGGVWSWGGLVLGGLVWGMYIPACTEAEPPSPPRGQTHACENITLAQLRCGR